MLSRAVGGHHAPLGRTNDWITPRELLIALGQFDYDPCASETQPWETAKTMVAPPSDGLHKMWMGRIWLNPPYHRHQIGDWMLRLAGHGEGTALVFARTETEWFQKFVLPHGTALYLLRDRINFHLPDGTRSKHNAGAPSVLIAYGERDAAVLKTLRNFKNWPGYYIRLRK